MVGCTVQVLKPQIIKIDVNIGSGDQAWGQVHFKILKYKYKYFETFASTSTSTFEIKVSLHICSK